MSPLRLAAWNNLLAEYKHMRDTMAGLITHGSRLGYCGKWEMESRGAELVSNLPMDKEDRAHLWSLVMERRKKGWVVVVEEGEGVVVSPVGTVPKANGTLRTINHLSWPRRQRGHPSINNSIASKWVALSYASIDQLLEEVGQWEGDCELWKANLVDAFFHVVVSKRDSCLLAFSLDGVVYCNTTLNFGGRLLPFLFNLLAEALHWAMDRLASP